MDLKPDFRSGAGSGGTGPRIVIVGGGASGVLMALHLLRRSPTVRVALIEKTDLLGCGVAYGTRDPEHVLNTRVSSMSAFADEPDHFLSWLRVTVDPAACPFSFVSRALYGRYLAETLGQAAGRDRLRCIRSEVIRLLPAEGGAVVQLVDGRVLPADHVVLATGHALPQPDPEATVDLPWTDGAPPAPDADILIVGTGLTMVDQVLTLLAAGHRGRIEAVSRRGLLPQAHADAAPDPIDKRDLPLGQPVSRLTGWLRKRVTDHEQKGGDWRSVVDGLRPHVQELWQALDTDARSRFLRHACAWWEAHRHRLPPGSAGRIAVAIAEGRLVLRRAAFLGARRNADSTITASLRPSGTKTGEPRIVHRVIDCRGIRRDPVRNAAQVVRNMLSDGLAHVDPLRLGIAVDGQAKVLRPDGSPLRGVVAIGPVSRSAFWEITAIPDIRAQAALLAARLTDSEHVTEPARNSPEERNSFPLQAPSRVS